MNTYAFGGYDPIRKVLSLKCASGHISDITLKACQMRGSYWSHEHLCNANHGGVQTVQIEMECEQCLEASAGVKHYKRLARHLHFIKLSGKTVVMTSGGYDPIHEGHVRNLIEASMMADYHLAIVNSNDFLIKKKGYWLIDENARAEIVGGIKGVDSAIVWNTDSTVEGAIGLFRPDFFAKGGDRSDITNIAEIEVLTAASNGCEIIFEVGGVDKPNSSSSIAQRLKNALSKTS